MHTTIDAAAAAVVVRRLCIYVCIYVLCMCVIHLQIKTELCKKS